MSKAKKIGFMKLKKNNPTGFKLSDNESLRDQLEALKLKLVNKAN